MKCIIIGKFDPPHVGHKFLIDFANSYVNNYYSVGVFVYGDIDDAVHVEYREDALREHYKHSPNIRFASHGTVKVPQLPEEHEDFWDIWKELIHGDVESLLGADIGKYDLLFASEAYGAKLAEVLGCKFVSVPRFTRVSGTNIRNNIYDHSKEIIPEFRRLLKRTVTICGPESTGKTMLTQQLAKHFQTVWSPEYARHYLEMVGVEVTQEKIDSIVNGQPPMWAAIEQDFNAVCFRDTDLFTTKIYAEKLLGARSDFILDKCREHCSDLYLVLDDNVKFVEDPQRYGGNHRQTTIKDFTKYLDRFHIKYETIQEENYEERYNHAILAVKRFMYKNRSYSI